MSAKKTPFMRWIDGQLTTDKDFARRVDEIVHELKIELELVALRERRGISQRAAAKLSAEPANGRGRRARATRR